MSESLLLKRRVVLVANTDWYLWNFRRNLAEALRAAGAEVHLVAPAGPYLSKLRLTGFSCHELPLAATAYNVTSELRALRYLYRLYRELRPDVVHHFTIKCWLYGGIAALRLGIPSVHAVTGLGHLFTTRSFRTSILRRVVLTLAAYLFRGPRCAVIFQNDEDRAQFGAAVRSAGHVATIRGSGVEIDADSCGRADDRPHTPIRFLYAGRFLREKGLDELIAACDALQASSTPFELWLAGMVYPSNPTSWSEQEVEAAKRRRYVRYLGFVNNMPEVLRACDVAVLPSYREGTSRFLIEAGASGLPLVGTDIAGIRGVIEPGRNGLLVAPRDSKGLAAALRAMAENPDGLRRWGQASKAIVEQHFSGKGVIKQTFAVYRMLLGSASDNRLHAGSHQLPRPDR